MIRRLQEPLAPLYVAIEARNQARIHLWYPEKHGLPYPALRCSTEGIDRFLTRNTQVEIRRAEEGLEVYAPHGFDDIAGLIVRPNPGPNFSAANYAAKAARWKRLWPELTVLEGGRLSSRTGKRIRVAVSHACSTAAAARMPHADDGMLPHHAGNKAGLAPRRLDLLFQKTVRLLADISGARIGPGPAFVVGHAGGLADLVASPPLSSKLR